MIANAMFYRASDNKSSSGVIQLGPLKFTMTQLYTSVISTLIVVPVNLLIVTIFRKAKLKHHGIAPMRRAGASHVVKNQFWRRVDNGVNEIELDEQSGSSNDVDYGNNISTIDVDDPNNGHIKKRKFK